METNQSQILGPFQNSKLKSQRASLFGFTKYPYHSDRLETNLVRYCHKSKR